MVLEPQKASLRRSTIGLATIGLVLFGLGSGGCEPDPVPLDLASDPDEPFPSDDYIDAEQAEQQRRAQVEMTQKVVLDTEAQRSCPQPPTEALDVVLHGGPTLDRISTATDKIHSIQLSVPPVALDGLQYYTVVPAWQRRSLSSNEIGCYVGAEQIYCGGREDPQPLASLIADQGLAENPKKLDVTQWLRLLAVFGAGIPYTGSTNIPSCHIRDPSISDIEPGWISLSPAKASISVPILNRWSVPSLKHHINIKIHDGTVEVEHFIPQWNKPAKIFNAVASTSER